MDAYDIFLFLHVSSAIIWLGAGFVLQVQSIRAAGAADQQTLIRAVDESSSLAGILFIPASFSVLVFGLLMVFFGPWSFGQLWIDLGLIGYAASAALGLLGIKPISEKFMALVKRDGVGGEALALGRRIFVISRIELVILLLVVANMVLKPGFDSVATLAAMVAALVGGVAVILATARTPSVDAVPAE